MHKVLCVGELLIDLNRKGQKIASSPAIFAWYSRLFGYMPYVLSAVGSDENGKRLLEELQQKGFDISYIDVINNVHTGVIKTTLENDIPYNDILTPAAFDELVLNPVSRRLVGEADILYFGTLGQRAQKSHETMLEVFELAKPDALRFFNVNFRQRFFTKEVVHQSLLRSDILQISFEELPVFANLFYLDGDVGEICRAALNKYGLKAVVLTQSSDGSVIFTPQGEVTTPGVEAERFVSALGAGDVFSAVVMHGFMKGASIEQIGAAANMVAAYVCGQNGPIVPLPPSMMKLF
jgi:fructokinase